VAALNAGALMAVQHELTRTVASIRDPTLRESMELSMSEFKEATSGTDKKKDGKKKQKKKGGMAGLYKALDKVAQKTRDEATDDRASYKIEMDYCDKVIRGADKTIEASSVQTKKNDEHILIDVRVIPKNDRKEYVSTKEVDMLIAQFQRIPEERDAVLQPALERVDERTKALDVLQKAEFILCEKMVRFRSTKQCRFIKSMPDIEEPQPNIYEGTQDSLLIDRSRSLRYEASMFGRWAYMNRMDKKKIGNPNPENSLES